MTDRNLRRLLHALKHTELLEPVYLVLKEPQRPEISNCDATTIQKSAERYLKHFMDSGLKHPQSIQGKPSLTITRHNPRSDRLSSFVFLRKILAIS